MARRLKRVSVRINNDDDYLDVNIKELDYLRECMDNGLFILFAPERASSALHTLDKGITAMARRLQRVPVRD